MADHLRARLACDASEMAINAAARPPPGLISIPIEEHQFQGASKHVVLFRPGESPNHGSWSDVRC